MFRAFGRFVVVLLLAFVSSRVNAKDSKLQGAIIRIDGEVVAVKGMDGTQEMKVEPGTKISSGGKPVMVADLKVGQMVQCVVQKKGGQIICTAMEILRDTP